MNDIEDPIYEPHKPQSLRSPVLPPQHEIDAHSLTHQQFHSSSRLCQQSKGRGAQYRRQHQEENVSITQLDYTFMHDPHQAPQRSGPTTHLHHSHCHRTYYWIVYSSTYLEEGLHSTSSCTTTSLDCEARLYKEHLAIRCRNIIDAARQDRCGRPQLTYKSKSVTSLLTSEPRKVEIFHRTSLTNFAQQGYNGAKTSKSNLIYSLQSHFLGHFNTASSFSTTTSYTLQGRHRTSRTTATTTAPTSNGFGECVLGKTSAASRHKSYA